MKKNGFAAILIILVIAILGIVGFWIYKDYILQKLGINPLSNTPVVITTPTTSNFDNLSDQEKIQRIADSHSAFGFSLMNKLMTGSQTENVIISPTSLSLALSMIYEGANGQTKTNMAKVLNIQDIPLNSLNNTLPKLYTQPMADDDVMVNIANSLWQSSSAPLLSTFVTNLKNYYHAENFTVDFNNGSLVADQVNSWVSDKTKGKINKIVDPTNFNAYTLSIIANAVYFKGHWTSPFTKSLTKSDTFHLNNGQIEQVNMMEVNGDFEYLDTKDFQAIKLPYGKSEKYGMYIFLPKGDLGKFTKSLTAEKWKSYISKLETSNGTLKMPSFKLDYSAISNLRDALSNLGMADAFTNKADFSGMIQKSDTPYFIDGIIHKTVIEVNEEGSEAAAATVVLPVAGGGGSPAEPFSMTVNKPFLFAISDSKTGEMLFLGNIQKI